MFTNPLDTLTLALDPAEILRRQGISPDPWQLRLLADPGRETLICATRQGGKSTTVAALALHTALFQPKSLTLIVSKGQRQAIETVRKVVDVYNSLGRPIAPISEAATQLELANGSRVIGLPGKEGTIRSYSAVSLLIIDEAARVPDDLYRSVRPMLAVSQGRLIAVSTPFGQRGWFWQEWTSDAPWQRVRATWKECPRITPEFIARERLAMGDAWVAQEYECSFQALHGLVYPHWRDCLADCISPIGRRVGGIDFGFRDPFAAVWGTYDPEQDLLWVNGERYQRERGLAEHAAALPKGVTWEADPSRPDSIRELRRANFAVRKACNRLEAGIAAVRSRMERGKLRIYQHGCFNLLAELAYYHYDPERSGEEPVAESDHACDALRYLVARIDQGFIARYLREKSGKPAGTGPKVQWKGPPSSPEPPEVREPAVSQVPARQTVNWHDPRVWEELI